MGRKQAVGWFLIALAGIASVSILTSAIVERSSIPVNTSEPPSLIGLEPIDGE